MRVFNMMLGKGRGGVESMALHYHRALAAEHIEVISLGHPRGELARQIDSATFRPLSSTMDFNPFAAFALANYCRAYKPALILAHGNRATGLCAIPAMNLRDRTVQVMHNAFMKPHLEHVRAALCVSESIVASVRASYRGTQVIEVPNFAPLDVRPVKTQRNAIPVIGALGRLHEQKGFDILIGAAAKLRGAGFAFELRIAGDGPERVALAGQVRDLNLHSQVTFCGWRSPVVDFLTELDLFVVPSRYEPFGLVVIEAMAAGIPVVAADIEGPRQILARGQFGSLFESENPVALVDTLVRALKDHAKMRDTAKAAQAQAIAHYGFSAGAKRLRSALEFLVDPTGSSGQATF